MESRMQGEPAEPSVPKDDPEEVAMELRRQVARLKRWFAWERWLHEPRSFEPPEESPGEDDLDS
jgi:hypothetical protein